MAFGAWALAVALAAGGTAPRPDARRVLLLIDGERDRELAARVEGQVADLDIAIVTAPATLPPEPEAQLATARTRAAEHRAEAVAWFRADGGGWVVRAAQGDRVRVRRVGPVAGELSASAAIEAVGLVVRTELRGLAAEGRIGDEPGAPASTRPWAEVGWAGVLDGASAAGQHGVVARGGAAAGRWRACAAFAYHPDVTLGSPVATVRVGRLSAGIVAGVDVPGPTRRGTPVAPGPRGRCSGRAVLALHHGGRHGPDADRARQHVVAGDHSFGPRGPAALVGVVRACGAPGKRGPGSTPVPISRWSLTRTPRPTTTPIAGGR